MAAASRSEDSAVKSDLDQPGKMIHAEADLRDNPWAYDFFQAVRLLERILPERVPVGRFAQPEREVVRFEVNNALFFPPSQIHGIDWSGTGAPRLALNFMGLTGPLGVLPYAYTELMVERERAKDYGVPAFFDIFNHRMISLFYQAWEKYRFPVGYERNQHDRFSRQLMSLIGLGTDGLQDRQVVPDQALIFYTGLLGLLPRSATVLEQIVADYFDVDVEVEQFVGAWYRLEPDNRCIFENADSYSEQVGFGAVVGDEIWDQQSRVRIKLGPLSARRYLDFLPCGKAFKPLKALTEFFSGGELEFEIQLFLKKPEVPFCELGLETEEGPQLGWFTWIKSRPPFDRDPGDTILLT